MCHSCANHPGVVGSQTPQMGESISALVWLSRLMEKVTEPQSFPMKHLMNVNTIHLTFTAKISSIKVYVSTTIFHVRQ